MNNDNEYLHNQLIKLGDMMGDGLHHEPDGKWISAEYRKISKILFPDMHKDMAKRKRAEVDERVSKVVSEQKCPCGGTLAQTRKGTKIMQCEICHKKYKLARKKR